ncbi:MAG: helix-turn-helix domain-containing protein [Candidatus Eisenbacteria bacterium]
MATTSVGALVGLGFSEVEARVYTYLLAHEPSTGYRISREIDKPTANTYKAIASLEAKGAVWVEEGENRICRAVAPDELLARMSRSFEETKERAAAALADLHQPDDDDRIYQIRSLDAVLERARSMLAGAERIVLADAFPSLAELLRDDFIGAAGRGVEVAVKLYRPEELPGVRVVLQSSGATPPKWPGEQLSLVADAREHLLALVDSDLGGVRQAVWSESAFLSCMHHNHVASEILLTMYEGVGPLPFPAHEIMEDAMGITLLRSHPPGLDELRNLNRNDRGGRG